MKTQVFCLKSQKADAVKIMALIRKHIFQDMEFDTLEISDNYNETSEQKEHEHCRSFLRLFTGSIIPVDDLTIRVTSSSGTWYYMGGYYRDKRRLLELFNKRMGSVFPAVAIMGRMVMMPYNVGDAFEKSREFPWFVKPRDLEGVVLVDFQNLDWVEDGIRQVGEQLTTDIGKLCRRHMLSRKIKEPDFEELAQLLDVSTQYLKAHRDKITASGKELSCSIVSGAAKRGTDSEVVLQVDYGSAEPLGRVWLYVTAPFKVLGNPIKIPLEFRGGRSEPQSVCFKVKPTTSPFCPLEALFTVDGSRPVAAPFPIPLILEVKP